MKAQREKWSGTDVPIQPEVLAKLPSEPIGFNKARATTATVDEDGVAAVICLWIEEGGWMRGVRKAYFALETGDYLGDAFLA